ncbi:MAG: hypothetical protein NFW17_01080 [Candidatus Accumulibacter sp.]|uniref:hypothetical protein n=1 Tax=Accumulibacter sp. TaxID=2053492 RepID=UPI0026015F1D|nr:hypothetical protein [Accumulibacter sp.]MCM8610673.1 hypothetical protein [Accumulibacter sp.]
MLFRLQCSADRQGQLYNLHTALIFDQDKTAETSGLVSKLALLGMRKLSQEVFALFKRTYIGSQRNFLADANDVPVGAFLGQALANLGEQESLDPQSEHGDTSIARRIASARSVVKSFVIYQLSNSLPPNGSGVGCGYYDEDGVEDGGGIAKGMNDYMFGTCFNPEVHESNVLLFLDHCLSHLSNSFFSGRDEQGYFATKADLPGGLDPKEMGRYWRQHRDHILGRGLQTSQRRVYRPNYIASYCDDLNGVFTVLDQLADESPRNVAEDSD